jgi:hypothetical protein
VRVRNERPLKGFAHRFQPTYAGANVGHPCGAVGPAKGFRARPAVHPAIVFASRNHDERNHAPAGNETSDGRMLEGRGRIVAYPVRTAFFGG